jgi:hypothetical protein
LAKIQEYDIEIKPLKKIKGQGLCKIIANGDALNGVVSVSIGKHRSSYEWYKYIVFFFLNLDDILSPRPQRKEEH